MSAAAELSPAQAARRLLRACDRATLATSLDGWPYASLVLSALDLDAAPLLLLSDLAEHTRNLRRDRRASLLFDGTAGLAEPLTGARVTVLGEVAATEDERLMARYLACHPAAELYRGFRDFHLFRLVPLRAHLVAGFGRIHWIEADALAPDRDAAASLAAIEPEILAHMNGDPARTLDLYAQKLLGRTGEGWRLTGIDPEGADLRREGAVARLDFPAPVTDGEGIRKAFVALANAARA